MAVASLCRRAPASHGTVELIARAPPPRLPGDTYSGLSENLLLETAVDERTVGNGSPAVGIIMGSNSDWKTMRSAALVLDKLEVPYETRVVSAHRTPDDLFKYAEEAEGRGLSLIIAGAGGAAHLPGMTASKTLLPVVGVPVIATPLKGLDALLSIMQMPAEVGVATMRVGAEGRMRHLRGNGPGLQKPAAARHTPRWQQAGTLWWLSRRRPTRSCFLRRRPGPGGVALRGGIPSRLSIPRVSVAVGRARAANGLEQQIVNLEADGGTVFIAASGRGIAFAGEIAKLTPLPVLGVPTVAGTVTCIDEFLQPFLEMPAGVATFALGRPGAINAALFAATITSERGTEVWQHLGRLRVEQVAKVRAMRIPPDSRGPA